ncbi:MAG: beta-lactamase family protein, partial [Candidatus Adiutrix sp.]|nr:beta-lactamase family protein [Candidatus Adiutrix sp.]
WALALKSGRGRIFEGDTVRRFITPAPDGQGPGRPLGFNVKRLQVILDGSGFSENAVGHLGYTGTSLWWDVEKNFLWALLTNRVHPSARNQGINDFRRLMARRLTAAWNH